MTPTQYQWDEISKLIPVMAQLGYCLRYMEIVPAGQLVLIFHHCDQRSVRRIFTYQPQEEDSNDSHS